MVLNFLFKVINTRMNTFELYVDNSNMFDNVCVSRPISPMFTRYPSTLLERKFNFHITVDLHITFSRHVLNNFKLLFCFVLVLFFYKRLFESFPFYSFPYQCYVR